MPRFSASYTPVPDTSRESVLDWVKAVAWPLLCQVCLLGRERPCRLFPGEQLGGALAPRSTARLRDPAAAAAGHCESAAPRNQRLINAAAFGVCARDFSSSPSGKNLFPVPPWGLRAAWSRPHAPRHVLAPPLSSRSFPGGARSRPLSPLRRQHCRGSSRPAVPYRALSHGGTVTRQPAVPPAS